MQLPFKEEEIKYIQEKLNQNIVDFKFIKSEDEKID